MESYNFEKCFNKEMTSGQALHVYVTLLKQVPKKQWDNLQKAYFEIDDYIIKRDCADVEKNGTMF